MTLESQARDLSNEHLPFTVGSGGPLIAIPVEVAAMWGSGRGTGIYGAHEDYDRACHPSDTIPTDFRGVGWVEIGGEVALVLEVDCCTQYLRLGQHEGVLHRAGSDEVTEWDIRATLERVEKQAYKQLPQTFALATGRFFAFDAAFAGAQALGEFDEGAFAMECELAPGVYDVFVAAVDGIDVIVLGGNDRRSRP